MSTIKELEDDMIWVQKMWLKELNSECESKRGFDRSLLWDDGDLVKAPKKRMKCRR